MLRFEYCKEIARIAPKKILQGFDKQGYSIATDINSKNMADRVFIWRCHWTKNVKSHLLVVVMRSHMVLKDK